MPHQQLNFFLSHTLKHFNYKFNIIYHSNRISTTVTSSHLAYIQPPLLLYLFRYWHMTIWIDVQHPTFKKGNMSLFFFEEVILVCSWECNNALTFTFSYVISSSFSIQNVWCTVLLGLCSPLVHCVNAHLYSAMPDFPCHEDNIYILLCHQFWFVEPMEPMEL